MRACQLCATKDRVSGMFSMTPDDPTDLWRLRLITATRICQFHVLHNVESVIAIEVN